MSSETVIVVGAGVLGLTSALHIQKVLRKNQNIVIVASDFPGSESVDYATPWSGAHYRPVPDSTPQTTQEATLALRTYEAFKTYATEFPEAGIRFMKGTEYLETPSDDYVKVMGRYGELDDFRVLSAEELPNKVKWGVSYKTWCVNTPVYTAHLLRLFILKGGRILKQRLSSLEAAFSLATDVSTVVNCSGVGFNDPSSFITRGQTCLVANLANETITRQKADGTWTFVIPRPLHGGTIIGGTKEEHDWESIPRPETRKKLLNAAESAFPELLNQDGKFDVIRDVVGRRPSRIGGMRLESEKLPGGRQVIHAYGAGGRGVEMSWGVAETVLGLYQARELQLPKSMM